MFLYNFLGLTWLSPMLKVATAAPRVVFPFGYCCWLTKIGYWAVTVSHECLWQMAPIVQLLQSWSLLGITWSVSVLPSHTFGSSFIVQLPIMTVLFHDDLLPSVLYLPLPCFYSSHCTTVFVPTSSLPTEVINWGNQLVIDLHGCNETFKFFWCFSVHGVYP